MKKFSRPSGILFFDLAFFLFSCFLILIFYPGYYELTASGILWQIVLSGGSIFAVRFAFGVYRQIWRYGGVQPYLRLMFTDAMAFIAYYILRAVLPVPRTLFVRSLSLFTIDLLIALCMRMLYRYAYKYATPDTAFGKLLIWGLKLLGRPSNNIEVGEGQRIRIAIIGAGTAGLALADELLSHNDAPYIPCCFIDKNPAKANRVIHGLPVYNSDVVTADLLAGLNIQQAVIAMSRLEQETLRQLYTFYRKCGCQVRLYDSMNLQKTGGTPRMRDFDPEELLFRKPRVVTDGRTDAYYRDKTVLITGGGGSIGSELCRQIARMGPKRLVILDVYENGAYDVQQELRFAYGNSLDLRVEIASVTDPAALDRAFDEHRPDIVLHAAAHKHVPLMEKNCVEAVKNNVFGTLNTVSCAMRHGAARFIMVSTDKAVNPTNIMGATKRMCEMIVLAEKSGDCRTAFSATRFGNVLGSAGSVIPLFKKQIAKGGPVTITDKRIIRYFMTIPEASQLVLHSGAIARNGELFVLDMGQPVKILDLAENMIRIAGMEPYRDIDIVETGLRPGEKLYEELLVRSEELGKTENDLIFVERDAPLTADELQEKLSLLRTAVDSGSDEAVRRALHETVPTFVEAH